jgi:flagellar biosynthesis/type III secretory pathway protein FliH
MQEQHGGSLGLSQVQYVFLELPKYRSGDDPQGTIDRWAYFFREAKNLGVVPPALSQAPYREALEVARLAGFSAGELDLYDRAKIAEQDARGALSLAERLGREEGREEGRAEGRAEGLREAVRALCQALEIEIDAEREAVLSGLAASELKELQGRLLRERRWS